jgi:hypothetical protein
LTADILWKAFYKQVTKMGFHSDNLVIGAGYRGGAVRRPETGSGRTISFHVRNSGKHCQTGVE